MKAPPMLFPLKDEQDDEDDLLTAWEKRQEHRSLQWQWFLIGVYVVGMVLLVSWIFSGE